MRSDKRGELFISCLASNFRQPIAFLVERLLKAPRPESIEDRPLSSEVDVSVSLVLLLVLEFESWLARARYFDKRSSANRSEWKSVLKWMKSLNDQSLGKCIDDLAEVYFLRDAIAHNHIWTYRQRTVRGKARYSQFDLDISWQSDAKKVGRMIAGNFPLPDAPRTPRLNLNVVPNFVGRRDVVSVFSTIKNALAMLQKLQYVKDQPQAPCVRFRDELSFPFWALLIEIQN